MRGALCALALCVAAAAKDDKAELPPAALADLPRLGADGTPVMTVDGRVCAFPWTGTDGVSHSTCAPLPASSAGDNVVWCKDIKAMWGICAAPRLAAAATVPAAAAATTASLPLMAGSVSATASAAAADALAPAPSAGAKAAATPDPLMERDDPDADDGDAVAPAPAAAAAVAPAPSVAAAPSPEQKLGPLRASKGPAKLDASAQGAVLRLRSQLADAQAAEGAAKDDSARSAAAAKTRFVRQQLAAVQAGFIDPSSVGGADAQGPQCNGLYRQCGGLQPGSNSDPWSGSAACCGNATCVQTDPTYAQCVPIDQSRSRGCGSLHAQCAGDFWAGPWCCATNLGCMWESKAFSKCQACNGAWAQCGGNEPDTGNKWSRATCCVSGHYCKWVNNGYSQCVKNGS
jgi:hypothetical protein